MKLHIAQNIAPQTAKLWLYSQERLKMLHNRLIIVSASGKPHPHLARKMQRLMHNIAAEIETERSVVMTIDRVEKQHRHNKSENRLRRDFGPVLFPVFRPLYRKAQPRTGWLAWVFGVKLLPHPARIDR